MAAAATHSQAQGLGHTVQVPLDHGDPRLGRAPLYFEFGAPFDRNKPVVFIIADGQQFYVRRGAIAQLQKESFGDAFNVVGIIGRGFTQEFARAVQDASGQTRWALAWRVFNSEQWVEDIDAVRRKLVGQRGSILLYGASGGAYLVHQYLMKYGAYVHRAFTASPVNPLMSRQLGIEPDRFWEEIGAQEGELQVLLSKALAQHPEERLKILITLQRQHFFVPTEKLRTARAELIRALAKGEMGFYEKARKEYQVEEILKLIASPTGIAIRVRELEFLYPSGAFRKIGGEAIYPYVESQYRLMQPLVTLFDEGKIPAPNFDVSAAHRLRTEVFILAARWDEAVDYRTAIALAYSYPRHQLFLADDNHIFEKLKERGTSRHLMQSFLRYGLNSPELRRALEEAEPQRWVER